MEALFDVAPAAVNVGGLPDGRWTSSAYGKLAEHLAIVELLARDHKVAVPVVDDDGVDLVVNYRTTVQVKNAHRQSFEPTAGYVYDGFRWNSKKAWREADVFLLHGAGRWWVVPCGALAGHGTSLTLYEGAGRGRALSVAAYEDRWDLFGG